MRTRVNGEAKAKKPNASERTADMWSDGQNGARPSVDVGAKPAELPAHLTEISCSGDELLRDDDLKPRWVVHGLIEETDTVLFSGEEKTALKTRALIDLAIARIVGGEWLGFRVESCIPAIVYFVTPESTLPQCKRTFRQLCKGRRIDPARVAPYLHFVVDETITVLPPDEIERVETEGRINAIDRTKTIADEKARKEATEKGFKAAEARARNLGSGVRSLLALYDAQPGSIGMLVFDTATTCWPAKGSQNDEQAARLYTSGARQLARHHGSPVFSIHHTKKSAVGGDARGARGSGELTAGHRVLLTADTSGPHPTMHFRLNGHAAPDPVGYALVPVDADAFATMTPDEKTLAPMVFERRAATTPKGKGKGSTLDDEEVLAVLQKHAPTALTKSKLREAVAKARGGKDGSKFNDAAVQGALDRLVEGELASKVKIVGAKGQKFDGYRAGSDDSPDMTKRVDLNGKGSLESFLEGATDV